MRRCYRTPPVDRNAYLVEITGGRSFGEPQVRTLPRRKEPGTKLLPRARVTELQEASSPYTRPGSDHI
jgi:hypothetical protein